MPKRFIILLLFTIPLLHCRKDRVDEDNVSGDNSIKLSFSDQVVLFDTVFTSVGSTTRYLKVYNTSSQSIKISSISLNGPNNAFFRMNVDGEAGSTVRDVFVAGKDSLFIFIDVTIDPNSGELLPFIVEGNIDFITNGNRQSVSLVAYGQEAFFITPKNFPKGLPPYNIVISDQRSDTTWTNKLPIVVYGYAVVDSTQHLTIEQGTQIYFHANSGLWIYRYGQLTVNGTLENPVVFQGDRLDAYKDVSGSWDRIWINDGESGKDNTIEYAVIKNSFIGVQAEYNPFKGFKDGISGNQVNLINTRIENTEFAGIYALNSKILGLNLLVTNSGGGNLIASGGGAYDFSHCTFANYWQGSSRSTPAVYLSHLYFDFDEKAYRQDSMNIVFRNSIIYGSQESEFNIEDEVDPGKKINFTMKNVLFKSNIDVEKYGMYTDTIYNPNDENIFVNPYLKDFKLVSGSKAVDFGDNSIISGLLLKDLDGKDRSDGKPDLGAFEIE